MAQSSSSQDLGNRSLATSTSTVRPPSRSNIRKENKGKQTLRVIASFTSVQELSRDPTAQPPTQEEFRRPGSSQCLEAAICFQEPPVKDPYTVRVYKGKRVRDVLIDTHDLMNEPGGFVINLSHHGQGSPAKELRIHLGIREKCACKIKDSGSGVAYVSPGTITTTDDYAREIFRAISSSPELDSLTAILEINDNEDLYERKTFPEVSPEFLEEFIQTYPMTLTKLHVEMPGVSSVYLPEWKFLLDQQFFLKYLTCNFGVVLWTFYEDCIMQNAETLERVILRRLQTYDADQDDYLPFNWQIFSECTNLEYLKITCGYKYRGRPHLTIPQPPYAIFLHENLEDLPKDDTFEELHLENIWVNPCVLEKFRKSRPNLKFCTKCKDIEYQDDVGIEEEDDEEDGVGNKVQLLTTSVVNLEAEIVHPKREGSRKRSQEKQLACLVLALFHVILLALAALFIIIYFRHLRGNKPLKNPFK